MEEAKLRLPPYPKIIPCPVAVGGKTVELCKPWVRDIETFEPQPFTRASWWGQHIQGNFGTGQTNTNVYQMINANHPLQKTTRSKSCCIWRMVWIGIRINVRINKQRNMMIGCGVRRSQQFMQDSMWTATLAFVSVRPQWLWTGLRWIRMFHILCKETVEVSFK